MIMLKKKSEALTFLAILGILVLMQLLLPSRTSALSGSEFQAGRVIDDGVFYNNASMQISDIQAFLNSKVPVCDTNGSQPYGGTTRAAYGTSRGYPPPYICLKEYSQNITGVTNSGSDLCKGSISGGWKLASQIIYEVANACGVNPKVLIVLLQKEQSLVTDDWPWGIQYRSATGYGCPDTAPCDSEYYGFFNQVYQAAKAFKRYQANPTNYNYRAGRNNNILWHPNSGCGSSSVFINNQATAGLYIYTPYRPNQAALDNLYGMGDGCSSYGNRNFWRMFNDWFGSTYADAYSAQPVWQYIFTDSTKTQSLGWNASLLKGSSAYAVVSMKNTGSVTWTRQSGVNDVMLGTLQPQDRQSPFCTGAWLNSCNRPVKLTEPSVAPGQIGTFEFPITAPQQPGAYTERFGLVINGVGYFPAGMNFQLNVEPERNSAQPVWQSIYTDSTKSQHLGWNTTLVQGKSAYAVVVMKNTGNIPWTRLGGNNDTMLGTVNGQDRQSPFCTGAWLYTCNRPVRLSETSVAPGQNGTFEFPITAPQQPGSYNEGFGLVVNGRGFFPSAGHMNFQLNVEPERNSAQPVWQSVFTDSSKTTSLGWNATLSPGQSAFVVVQMKNTGNITWTRTGGDNDTMIGTLLPQDRQSVFCAAAWLHPCNRGVRLKEISVAPGQNGTFEFPITAPTQVGTYNESFGLVVNGRGYFPNGFMNFRLIVQ